jgi:D-alanyl-D-alanine carboxypeptidase
MNSSIAKSKRFLRRARPGVVFASACLVAAAPSTAGPALLFDATDSKVLYAEDADHLWHPASLTKIMTAYIVFEALKAGKIARDTKLVVTELANSQPPSKVGMPIGATITVDLALQSVIVKSANDMSVVLAEGIGGTVEAFVDAMNETAKKLGMSRTRFVNPNGLPAAEQVTTARDLGKLARAILKDFPEYAALWAQSDMRIGRLRLRSHNGLLKTYDGADGLKTGFTCDSGYNVVATAVREGRKMVAVVLGEASGRERSVRAASLLEHGFQTSEWRATFDDTKTIDNLPLAADARATVTNVRQSVINWACGNRKRRAPAAAAVAKSKQARQAAKQVAAPAQPSVATAPPAPAPKQAAPAARQN